MELTAEQQELVELAKRVPAHEVPSAKQALEALIDGFWEALQTAPSDDEEVIADDVASLERARAEFDREETVSHAEILREFGIQRRLHAPIV